MSIIRDQITVMEACERNEVIEILTSDTWVVCHNPAWNWVDRDYRVKPKARELWVNVYNYSDELNTHNVHTTKESADRVCNIGARVTVIKFVEVLDD